MAATPIIPVVNQMLDPPTDEDTLSMFVSPDERVTEINAHIVGHPIAQSLREKAEEFRETRPILKIPEAMRAHHLTAGALTGPGRIEVPPLMFIEKEGKGGMTLLYLGTDICGHPGLVHGGALATLLDEILARCSFAALPNKMGMTANLNINYRKPVPGGSYILIRAKTTKVEGRKVWVEGSVESLPEDDQPPVVFTEATALYIEPKQAKV